MSKDEQRAAVLQFYYDYNSRVPGGVEQTAAVAQATGLDLTNVSEAQQYLIDKGFLYSGPRQQVRALDLGFVAFFARITDRGIDFVEHPGDDPGAPAALVTIFASGPVSGINVAGRDQQLGSGGVMIQGSPGASATSVTFPIEQLRELLVNDPEGLAKLEEINCEVSSPSPQWGKVVQALESFSKCVGAAQSAQTIIGWLQRNPIPAWVLHAAQSFFLT